MKLLHSLHAKIVLGYCVVGASLMALLVNALFQFRSLEGELAKQQDVVAFYDTVRHARRLEKNFLLYRKVADIGEAVEQANLAQDVFRRIPLNGMPEGERESSLEKVARYAQLLGRLMETAEGTPPSPVLLQEVYEVGSALLRLGERLDALAQKRVDRAVQRHDADLLAAIWMALGLAVVAGIVVTRSVIRPLRDIESDLKRVAKGEVARVAGREAEAEVASLTRSINDTLQEVTDRQTVQARASRLMALGTMLSGVAHEMNNPLSNISSSCQILEEEWHELPAGEVRRLLAQIDSQVLRAQHIVATLLDFSGNRALRRRREKVREIIDESLALIASQMPSHVRTIVDVDAGLTIDVDRRQFLQVLVNVIKNAVEASPVDGVIRISAWREELPEGRGTAVEIEDEGEGIACEHLRQVFDPFYTTKAVGKGTGLGLFVAHEIIAQHGGNVAVDSSPDGGARFWIHIPDTPDDDACHA